MIVGAALPPSLFPSLSLSLSLFPVARGIFGMRAFFRDLRARTSAAKVDPFSTAIILDAVRAVRACD
jgi:hypothetical protein